MLRLVGYVAPAKDALVPPLYQRATKMEFACIQTEQLVRGHHPFPLTQIRVADV